MLLKSNLISKSFSSAGILATALILPTMFASTSMATTSQSQSSKIFIKESRRKKTNLNNAIASNSRVSKATINLVKKYEGFRSNAYIDTNGLPVIGYGQSKINGKRVKIGQSVSQAKADIELEKELYQIQLLVLSKVKVKLNSNQLGALTSIVYNVGSGILNRSTLIEKLNAGDYAGAAKEFPRWNKAHQGGKLVPLAGLTKRRLAEQKLFLTP